MEGSGWLIINAPTRLNTMANLHQEFRASQRQETAVTADDEPTVRDTGIEVISWKALTTTKLLMV